MARPVDKHTQQAVRCKTYNAGVAVSLTCLHIGHICLMHGYLLHGKQALTCAHCDAPLMVQHILIECPFYNCHTFHIQGTIEEVL
jgi:hypothetical protein